MEKHKITQIAKELNITHGAVSQWFNGLALPKYKYMLLLNQNYNIPFEAWKDIKSYINESVSGNDNKKQLLKNKDR